jgi:hypothetical protein
MNELNAAPMGGEGQTIQADETYYGNSSKRAKGHRAIVTSVVALVEPQGRAIAVHVSKGSKGHVSAN